MMSAWAHLPNAAHIDRIIADVQARPEAWAAASDAARDAAWLAASDAASDAAWLATSDAARDAAWDAAWDAASDAARDAARDAAWLAMSDAARDAVSALIAWDDCAHLLDTDPEHVRILALLGHLPAVLLLPAVTALNKSMTYSV